VSRSQRPHDLPATDPAPATGTAHSRGSRQQVRRLLRAALLSLEEEDQGAWRAHVDALIYWRSQPLVQGLARLAGELARAFGEQPHAGAATDEVLQEACTRLSHVVEVSERASHDTLDRIEQCRALLSLLPAQPGSAAADALASLRAHLSEMTAAQGYQDLTGQIILRVVDIVRSVQTGHEITAGGQHLSLRDSRGHGPAVAGLDPAPVSQDAANHLLSSLGL